MTDLVNELEALERPEACIGKSQYIPISRATLRRILTALRQSEEPSEAVLAERERCAKVAENSDHFPQEGAHIAAAIRQGDA